MEFSLLENGIDSLRQAQNVIDENYLSHEFESFQLKDGLFNYTHGIEVLAKYIIKENNEENIFCVKREYKLAKQDMKEHHRNVFEVNPELKTISVSNALKLLKNHFNLNNNLYMIAMELIKKRNSLMHYTVEMNLHEKELFAEVLRNSIKEMSCYFAQKIPEFQSIYRELERNYPYTEYDKYEDDAITAAEARYEDDRLGI